jgi:segregation and condensation protein B
MRQELRILEALLFASTEPVAEAMLASHLPDDADVPTLLDELSQHYTGRGVNLMRVAGKWSLRTAEDLAAHLRVETKVGRKPSRAAVETLAIVAYHQPLTRTEVEEIRGVSSSRGSFDVLLEAGWIRPVGRRKTPGQPVTWGTTPKFLEDFALDQVSDLPGIDELKASGLLDTRPSGSIIRGMPVSGETDAQPDDGDAADEDSVEELDPGEDEIPPSADTETA